MPKIDSNNKKLVGVTRIIAKMAYERMMDGGDDIDIDSADSFVKLCMDCLTEIDGKAYITGQDTVKDASTNGKASKPKSKGANSWICFTRDYRDKHPDDKFKPAELSEIWKQMSDSEREVYDNIAKEISDKMKSDNGDDGSNEESEPKKKSPGGKKSQGGKKSPSGKKSDDDAEEDDTEDDTDDDDSGEGVEMNKSLGGKNSNEEIIKFKNGKTMTIKS